MVVKLCRNGDLSYIEFERSLIVVMPSVLMLNVVRLKVEEPNEKERRDEKRKSSTGRADKRKELNRKSQKEENWTPKGKFTRQIY